MDVERIRQALAVWDSSTSLPGRGSREDAGDVLAEVARLVAEAREINWCPDHQSRWGYNPLCGWSPTGDNMCPKVRARLLVPPKGET